MNGLQWFFPEKLDVVPELLKRDGIVPHAGGTFLIKTGMKKVKGLIDLANLPLDIFHDSNGFIEIGSTSTFSGIVEKMSSNNADSILVKSLGQAASTPLRNRITIGGSIASFPIWSDAMGPLIALDAEVSLIGAVEGFFSIVRYVTERELRKETLIKSVRFKSEKWDSYYFRATRTQFDYPAFNITVLCKRLDNVIKDIRIVIVGNRKKFVRITGLEEKLMNVKTDDADIPVIVRDIDIEFAAKKLGSADYIKQLAGIELERGINRILRSK